MKHYNFLFTPKTLLYLFLAFIFICNVIWIGLDNTLPRWDPVGHTLATFRYYQMFTGKIPFNEFFSISTYYPPGIYIILAFVMVLFNFSYPGLLLCITVFFILLLYGVYILTKCISQNAWIALFVTISVAFLHSILQSSREYLLEIPLMSFIIWTYIYLYKTYKHYTVTSAIILSLFIAFTLLTKWTSIIYLLVPIIYFAVYMYKHYKKHFLQLLLIHIVVLSFLVLPWYITNIEHIISTATYSLTGESTDPKNLLSLDNIFFYIGQIMNIYFSLWVFILVVPISLYWYTKYYKHNVFVAMGALSMLVIYSFFTFLGNKDARYIMPLMYFLVLGFFMQVSVIRFSKIYSTFILGLQTVLALGISFSLLPPINVSSQAPFIGWIEYINTTQTVLKAPTSDTSFHTQVLSRIRKEYTKTKERIFLGADTESLNTSRMLYLTTMNNLDTEFINSSQYPNFTGGDPQISKFIDDNSIRYFFIPTGEKISDPATRFSDSLWQIRGHILGNRQFFIPIDIIKTQDEGLGDIVLYKRVREGESNY